MDDSGERRDSFSDSESSRSEAEQESDAESRARSRSRGHPRDATGGSEAAEERRDGENIVGKSSSEDERRETSEGESTEDDEAVQFDRGQPHAVSIRVRKPKKKVYADPKGIKNKNIELKFQL